MSKHPASDEVAAALGAFVGGGDGPTHTALTRAFSRAGYGSVRPYDASSHDFRAKPNKENRIRDTVEAAVRDPHHARELIESLLVEFRSFGSSPRRKTQEPRPNAAQRCEPFNGHSLASIGNSLMKAICDPQV